MTVGEWATVAPEAEQVVHQLHSKRELLLLIQRAN